MRGNDEVLTDDSMKEINLQDLGDNDGGQYLNKMDDIILKT